MGQPWWYYDPSLFHSPRLVNSHLNTDALNEDEIKMVTSFWMNWNQADWAYGQTTLIFFCIAIGLVSLFNTVASVRRRFASLKVSFIDRLGASMRYCVARQYEIPLLRYYSPPLAAIIGVCGMFVFVMGLTFGRRPYYWPNMEMGHSSPLATRTGWISLGIMPFMIAFAAKVNLVAIITNSSHEKMQVFHRWSALFMYITSLIHTFLFIVRDIGDAEEMHAQWYDSPFYWTGVAALVPQTVLIFLSWSVTRDKYYETFKKIHYLASGVFMVALFIHVNLMLSSWDYFMAALAIFLVTWFARGARTFYNSGLFLNANVEALPDSFIRVTVNCPSRVGWRPGQHVFIRFLSLGVHAFSSHPFTIASLSKDKEEQQMELVFRVYNGMTKSLQKMLHDQSGVSLKVWVDGPYGGSSTDLKGYEKVLLIAGGSGASFTLPLLNDLVHSAQRDGKLAKDIEFVLAVREPGALSWMQDDLDRIKDSDVSLRVHFTGSQSYDEKLNTDSDSELDNSNLTLEHGRPDVDRIVKEAFRKSKGERMAIAVCGPESMVYAVRNAVADCQLAIMDGFSKCPELFLHTESYSW